MLIERQVAPALVVLGGALVMPDALSALRGISSQPSVTTLIVGNVLAGVGLLMGFLLFLDQAQHRFWRALVLVFLGAVALLFSAGTALVAFQIDGTRAVLLALAASAPLLGIGVGLRCMCRDMNDARKAGT